MVNSLWPLTGRTAQLEELGRHYREPDCGGVVLFGPAGVGKTRLAEEALRLAEQAGRPSGRAVGHPTSQEIPLGALAHLLPATLVRDLGVGADERTALFHAARGELRRLAGDDRLVLLVDDFDLLDDTSIALLVPLVVARTVFLIGTVRTSGGTQSTSSSMATLLRDGHLVRIDLAPLTADDLSALLHRALDGPLSVRALGEFARLSGGNLQVLTELVRAARDRGVLVESEGGWDLTAPLPTTTALDELVGEHLADIDAAGLAALELLAVSERFGLSDLERAHGSDTLESLEAKGLVSVVTSGRRTALRLAHPLYGEVLRARLAPLHVRRIRKELADSIDAHGARRCEDLTRVAVWRLDSGGEVDADCLLHAARLALVGREPALAVRLVSAVPDDPAPDGISIGDRAEVLAEAYSMQGRDDQVEAAIESVWDAQLPDAVRAQLARRLADTRFSGGSDLDGALAAFEAARQRMTDPAELAANDARRAAMLAGAGRPVEALRIVDGVPDPVAGQTAVELATARAASLISLGRCDEAVVLSRRAAADQAVLPGWFARRGISLHVLNEAHALTYVGHYAAARELLVAATDRGLAANARGAWVWFEMALAEIARDTGRGAEAVRRFQAAADAAPQAGQSAALVWAHVGVAQGYLILGDCQGAAAALSRADEAGDSPVATSIATRERTRAWLDACRGDLPGARDRIRQVIPDVRRDSVFILEVALCHDLVRLDVPAEVVDRLDELARQVDGPLVRACALHAHGLIERDVDVLADAVDQFELIDALGLAAEVAAELAEVFRSRAESRRATAAQLRSSTLAERAGGVRTPTLTRGLGVEPLTGREREVALLAAGGRSSREIGERLFLSTRTVETHLARVYRKLGISGRAELGDALDPGT